MSWLLMLKSCGIVLGGIALIALLAYIDEKTNFPVAMAVGFMAVVIVFILAVYVSFGGTF